MVRTSPTAPSPAGRRRGRSRTPRNSFLSYVYGCRPDRGRAVWRAHGSGAPVGAPRVKRTERRAQRVKTTGPGRRSPAGSRTRGGARCGLARSRRLRPLAAAICGQRSRSRAAGSRRPRRSSGGLRRRRPAPPPVPVRCAARRPARALPPPLGARRHRGAASELRRRRPSDPFPAAVLRPPPGRRLRERPVGVRRPRRPARRAGSGPRPSQCSQVSLKTSSRPCPTRLRVICTSPSEVTSATWCLVRSRPRHSSSRRSTRSRLDSSTMSMKSMTMMPPMSRSRS